MSQFNLLPDIKLHYLKAERTRKLVITISTFVSAGIIVITIGVWSLVLLQKHQIGNLNKDIKQKGYSLSSQSNLNDILTIQNQIQTLTSLHEQEPEATDLQNYLNEIVPTTASINSMSVDFNADNINLSGNADTLATVNQLVDSLKFSTYSVQGQQGIKPAFSSVVLSSFGVAQSGTSYTVQFNFDPALFNNTETVNLNVPSKVSTRSQLDQPTTLFVSNSNGG